MSFAFMTVAVPLNEGLLEWNDSFERSIRYEFRQSRLWDQSDSRVGIFLSKDVR
jgi:hypothetical protein